MIKAISNIYTFIRPFRFVLSVLVVILSTIIAQAQTTTTTSATDGMTPRGITPGSPSGSYPLSGFDNVNLYNGNLNFRLPLMKISGRGGAQMTMMLSLDIKTWRTKHFSRPDLGIESWSPEQNKWEPGSPGYGPGALYGRQIGTGTELCGANGTQYINTLTRLTFITPDGTEYELRDQLTGGKPLPNSCSTTGQSRGKVFVSADGTAVTFISNSEIRDRTSPSQAGILHPSGLLILSDGTRYGIVNGNPTWMRDRNGNKLNFTYDTVNNRIIEIKDSLNRIVTIQYKVQDPQYGVCDHITYKGVGGVDRIIRVSRYALLSTAFRPFANYSTKLISQLFSELDGSEDTLFNPKVTNRVVLPNGKSYRLYYNEYGELERVDLPTGGVIEYRMNTGSGVVSLCSDCDKQIYRRVVERRVYEKAPQSANTTPTEKTTYAAAQSGPLDPLPWFTTVTVDQLNPSGGLLGRSKHYFKGSGLASLFEATGAKVYPVWDESREDKTEMFDTNGTTLRRETRSYRQRAAVGWWAAWATAHNLNSADEPPNDVRQVETVTRLMDVTPNLITKRTSINPSTGSVGFDQYNNQTDVWEYDFGSGSEPAHPTRHTHTDYVTVHPASGIDYTAYNSSSPEQSVHIRRLPRETVVYAVNTSTGADIQPAAAKTQYAYDETTPLSRLGIIGWESPATTARGNLTTTRRWLDTSNTWIATTQKYDVAGNIIEMTDGRGNTSQVDFSSDSNAYAFPSATRTAVPDPTGQAGSSTRLETTYIYDFASGLVISSTDPNGQTTSYSYIDPLDRVTTVVRPAGAGQTVYAYGDNIGDLYVRTETSLDNTRQIVSHQYFDGLGRATRSFSDEGDTYIVTDTQYDAAGRVSRVSNPHRTAILNDSNINPSGEWTTNEYDGLGRIKKVTRPDQANSTTAYLGNQTTETDEAGKKQASVTDGLGRLIKVTEDPTGALNYVTTYAYNALDSLTTVTQGTQPPRQYIYDSLGRLLTASNPEHVAQTTYAYDANSNLETRTDPRGIVTSYTYDNLNRVKRRSYSNVPTTVSATPAVDYKYDNIVNGRGKLVSVKYGSTDGYYYDGFDAAGRVTASRQVTDNQPYTMSYEYDLAGNITRQTYPSGKIVETQYDAAGRIAGVKKQDGTYYAGAGLSAADAANRLQYTPHGAVSAMKFGKGLWERTTYNNRLQPTAIKLGTQSNQTSLLQLSYVYETFATTGLHDNNGNILKQTITVPSPNGLSAVQDYTYDGANRLLEAKEGGGQSWRQRYSYDRYGNRRFDQANTSANVLGPNPLIDPLSNRYSAGQGYSYDEAGNLKAEPNKSYKYDAENRLGVYNDGAVSYTYDGDGRRVKKTVAGSPSVTTVFVYNAGGQLGAEYGGEASGAPGVSYLTTDHLGSTRVVTDKDQGVKARRDYLPFGEEIGVGVGARTAAMGYDQDDSTTQKFTSKERDSESNLDYFLARYYSSVQGRFTSVDPANAGASPGDAQSWNGYAIARNNPMVYVDPTGLAYDFFMNGNWYRVNEAKDFEKYGFKVYGTSENGNELYIEDGEGNRYTATFTDTPVDRSFEVYGGGGMTPIARGVAREMASRKNASITGLSIIGAVNLAPAIVASATLSGGAITSLGAIRLGSLGKLLFAFEQEIATSGATTMVARIFALEKALQKVGLGSIKVDQLLDGGYGIHGKKEIVKIAVDGTVTVVSKVTGEILKVIK